MTDPSPYDPDLDNALDEDTPPPEDDLLYDAWSVIANASDWRLSRESDAKRGVGRRSYPLAGPLARNAGPADH